MPCIGRVVHGVNHAHTCHALLLNTHISQTTARIKGSPTQPISSGIHTQEARGTQKVMHPLDAYL
jgi:hypothetical protein